MTIEPRNQRIYEKLSIVFLYSRGRTYQTSLAIDDARVKPGACRDFPQPPPPTMATTTTTTMDPSIKATKWTGVPTATTAIGVKAARALAPKPRPSVGSKKFCTYFNLTKFRISLQNEWPSLQRQ